MDYRRVNSTRPILTSDAHRRSRIVQRTWETHLARKLEVVGSVGQHVLAKGNSADAPSG